MTLVVSIGAAILPASMLGAGAATAAGTAAAVGSGIGAGAAGAALGSTVAATTLGGALAAGTVGAGALAGAGLAANEMAKGPPKSTPNTPTLAPGLSPAMTAGQVYGSTAAPAASPMAGLASIGQEERKAAAGGLMMARGGEVPVRDGAYIIPADVVSALGNGSSKAGAEFLRRLMEEVKSQGTKRHGLGAVHRASA